VELYLNSPNTPSWRGAELKHRDFTFTTFTTTTTTTTTTTVISDGIVKHVWQ